MDTIGLVDTREASAKRRVWPDAVKRQLLAETMEPGQSVSIVARRHDLNTNLLFKWRRQMRAATGHDALGGLLPVTIAPMSSASASGIIEIDLGDGRRLRIEGAADPGTLRTAIEVLAATARR